MTVLMADALLADEGGKGSPIGLFVVLSLCVAVYFLWRSMNRHLRKVPPSFGGENAPDVETIDDTVTDSSSEAAPTAKPEPPTP